jgi:hypothetical protein
MAFEISSNGTAAHLFDTNVGRRAVTPMERIGIGTSGLIASRIALGTWAIGGWMWGGTSDLDESVQTIRSAIERGITLIDTAPVYGFGRSEEIVGLALSGGLRERAIIATKVGLEWRDGKVWRNLRRAHPTGGRGLTAAPSHRPYRPLPGALARSARSDSGDCGYAGAFAPRGKDPRDRRVQLFAGTDG